MLLSFVLLVAVGSAVGFFAWIYRRRLLVLFGIVQPQPHTDDPESQEHKGPLATEIGLQGGVNPPSVVKQPRPIGQHLRHSNSATTSGSAGGSEFGNDTVAPMIVIAGDESNRGTALPYDDVARACGSWAESRRLGSGGAATVYRAELARYGAVAVKRFHPKDGSSREWTRELEALVQCRHPNILEIIGHADEGPENLIIMPLMEGGTLCERLHQMVWSTRVVDVGQVVRAVSFLHGKGILHRDIKSSNILLDASLRHTRLADFGLAKDQTTKPLKTCHGTTGVVMGSPGYMAPELMMRPATEKTDAYALGVVLLEILTGLPAWDSDENGAVLTDRAVPDGRFEETLLDPAGRWIPVEAAACAEQAIALTLFDPNQRKTLASVEQDPAYTKHLERATAAEAERLGTPPASVVALGLPG